MLTENDNTPSSSQSASWSTDRMEQIEPLRNHALTVLLQLEEQSARANLPLPPENMVLLRQQLLENHYKVLVIGEAKRGKSTFINALIGQSVLPTDVSIATNRAFLVRHAQEAAYRLRFEDNSEQAIQPDELTTFGSQIIADADGVPRISQIIRWIEVDVPVRFLPDGIQLLDTPGLGSLYAAHSQITQRFIPYADAVIYVFDSTKPISQTDLQTIGTVINTTNNLFFIQTRIDQFDKTHWQTVKSRNEEILRRSFEDRIPELTVWPISSTNLIKAVEMEDEDYEIISRHRELNHALQCFLFQVVGLNRIVSAIMMAEHYHANSHQILLGRVAALTEEFRQIKEEFRQKIIQKQEDFDNAWGKGGHMREELLSALQRLATAGKQDFVQTIQSGGELDLAMRSRIDATRSIEEAQHLGDILADVVAETVVAKWQKTEYELMEQFKKLIMPFWQAAADLSRSPYEHMPAKEIILDGDAARVGVSQDWMGRIKAAQGDFMRAFGMVGVGASLAAGAATAIGGTSLITGAIFSFWFPPLAVAAGLWAVAQGIKGWLRSKDHNLYHAQQELHKYLAKILHQVNQYYLHVDLANGQIESIVDDYFAKLVHNVHAHIQQVSEQKSEETKQELARLIEEAKLNKQEREETLKDLQQHLAHWENLGQEIQYVVQKLEGFSDFIMGTRHATTPPQQDEIVGE